MVLNLLYYKKILIFIIPNNLKKENPNILGFSIKYFQNKLFSNRNSFCDNNVILCINF